MFIMFKHQICMLRSLYSTPVHIQLYIVIAVKQSVALLPRGRYKRHVELPKLAFMGAVQGPRISNPGLELLHNQGQDSPTNNEDAVILEQGKIVPTWYIWPQDLGFPLSNQLHWRVLGDIIHQNMPGFWRYQKQYFRGHSNGYQFFPRPSMVWQIQQHER